AGLRLQRGLRQQVAQAAHLAELAIDALRDPCQVLQPRGEPPRRADVMEELLEPEPLVAEPLVVERRAPRQELARPDRERALALELARQGRQRARALRERIAQPADRVPLRGHRPALRRGDAERLAQLIE